MIKPTAAEFEVLKQERDSRIQATVKAMCAKWGWDIGQTYTHVSGAGLCYCDCPLGPCQHEFTGWREFEDGNGGEAVCKRCGVGAMAHSMRVGL